MPSAKELLQKQSSRFRSPEAHVFSDLEAIYQRGEVEVGWPEGVSRLFDDIARDNSIAIGGVALGDEGKGRLVDNKLEALLAIAGVQRAYVIRYQGGSNAGHTVERDGIKLALHQVPSGVLYPEVVGIMDRGMVIHPEDLAIEVDDIEATVGDTRGKLILACDAILVTDLERAEERLNRIKQGKAAGGTGRGVAPAYAHFYDRLGLTIADFVKDDWRAVLGAYYDRYTKEFAVYDMDIASMSVPDLRATRDTGQAEERSVGTKEEFLDRLEAVRTWLVEREMVQDTFLIHREIYDDLRTGVLFEGAQALGLHAWLGTRPDVTASDTSVYGIQAGTAYWRMQDIKDRIGVFKLTYTSSVGARHMPTEIPLPKNVSELPPNATDDQRRGAYIREAAHEYGTTTGRPRDILHLDLPMLMYNCRMAGIEVLAGTHLDIGREGEPIKVCTHYINKNGFPVPYEPGLEHQKDVISQYVELPGWDGELARRARTFVELPDNAKKFLAFIQRFTGYPIVAATTGPVRENIVTFPGY